MDAGYGNQEPTTETQPLTVGDTKTQGSLLCEPPNGNAPAMPDAQLAGVASPNSSTSRTRPADPPRQASRSFERVLVAWQESGFGLSATSSVDPPSLLSDANRTTFGHTEFFAV